jgi:cell wall-associated NlpC family hydrolase
MPATTRRSPVHTITALCALLLMTTLLVLVPLQTPRADALTAKQRDRVMHIAASKRGAPYRYGASGPRAFDCSGYTRWVFAKVGRRLPHNAAAQSRTVRHVRAAHRHRGDLVFFSSGGHVYHVAIYAGHDRIWHAPRPGKRVERVRLWTHAVFYGRVR